MENAGNNPRPIPPNAEAAIKEALYNYLLGQKVGREKNKLGESLRAAEEARARQEREEKEREEASLVDLVASGMTGELRDGVISIVGKDNFEEALITRWQEVNAVARKHIHKWSKEQLHHAYQEWLTIEYPNMPLKLAQTRLEILQIIEDVAKEKKCWAYIRSGSEHEAESPLQLKNINAEELKKKNGEVGEKFGELIKQDASGQLDEMSRAALEGEKEAWENLREKYKLLPLSAYNSQDANRYSLQERAMFKAFSLLEEKLDTVDSRIQEKERQLQAMKDSYRAQQPPSGGEDVRSRMKYLPQYQAIREDDAKRKEFQKWHEEPLMNELFQRAGGVLSSEIFARDENPSGVSYKDNYAEMVEQVMNQSWDGFAGWSDAQRDNLIEQLRRSASNPIHDPKDAKRILAAFLLRGYASAAVEEELRIFNGDVTKMLDRSEILYSDEEVFSILVPHEGSRESMKEGRYISSAPRDVEDLAWQMAFANKKFRQEGPYPMFKQVVKQEHAAGKITFSFEERIIPGHIMMWLRDNIWTQHDNSPQDAINLGSIMLKKQYTSIDLGEILLPGIKMMKSRYADVKTDALQAQLTVEAMLFSFIRNSMIDLIWNQANEKGSLQETLKNIFFKNNLTRPLFGYSLMAHIHRLAESYDPENLSDGKMGATINSIFKAYFNIGSPRMLADVLQVSDLNTLFGRENIAKVQQEVLRDDQGKNAQDIFDVTKIPEKFDFTNLEDRKKFVELFNFYGARDFSEHMKAIVRRIVKDRAAELHGLQDVIKGVNVDVNKDLAELIAFSLTHILGVKDRNDFNAGGWSALVKFRGQYREKQASGDRAGTFGDLRTIGQFLDLLAPAMYAIRTTTDSEGGSQSIWELMDKIGDFRSEREAPILEEVNRMNLDKEIREKIQELRKYPKWADKSEAEIWPIAAREAKQEMHSKLLRERLLDTKLFSTHYERLINQFYFDFDASQVYFTDQVTRGFELDDRLRGAKELKFDNYIIHDHLLGAVFDQEKFQNDFSKMATAVRYFTDAKYRLDEIVPVWNKEKQEHEFKFVGETLFGPQLVNVPQFWMTEDPDAIYDHGHWVVKVQAKDKKGRLKFKNGKKVMEVKEYHGQVYEGVVDWSKVDGNRRALRKRWMEVLIEGMMLQHRQLTEWSFSPRYSFNMVENIWEAIERIPGEVFIDKKDMKGVQVTSQYFDHESIKRMRKESGTSKAKMYAIEFILGGLFGRGHKDEGLFSGVGSAFGLFIGGVFKEPAR